jgi:hypothetical protein
MSGLRLPRPPARISNQLVAGRNPHDVGYDPTSCAELFCAVIGLAIKDLALVEYLESKTSLSDYESKKLLGLTADDHLAHFLESDWFEQICGMLDIHPEMIRLGVRTRRAGPGTSIR